MNSFKSIKNTWKKASREISDDKTVDSTYIKKAITTDSKSISASMLINIRAGMFLLALDIVLFAYNAFFYTANIPVFTAIFLSLLLLIVLLVYLIIQTRKLTAIELRNMSLFETLVCKIEFFKTSYTMSLRATAFATAFIAFAANLTQQNANGEFNISNIPLLITIYVLFYVFFNSLYKLSSSIYLKQLTNALSNLEQNILDEMEHEMAKNRKTRIFIGLSMSVMLLAGIVMYFIAS